MSKLTTLMTTCLVASAFNKVCFTVLFRTRLAGENINIGGFELNTLKKLNGDKFGMLFLSTVLANAIGRGPTAPWRYPCNLTGERSFGSMLIMLSICTKIAIV